MFELSIKCSKDIDELHINFSDGTSVVKSGGETVKSETKKSKPRESKTHKEPRETVKKNIPISQGHGGLLDTDVDYSNIDTSVVQKPDITQNDRAPKVATELQNLDI